MKIIKAFVCFIALITSATYSHADGMHIVKWVDKNGITHYGDKAPMPTDTNRSSLLNKDGMTVKKIHNVPTNHQADKALTEQSRQDAALLASYSNADEIDIARDRNAKIDEFSLANLQQKRSNLQQSQEKNQAKIDAMAKNKQTIPKLLLEEKQNTLNEMNETDRQILAKKQDIEKLRQRYDNDKQRYLELKALGYTPNSIKNANKTAEQR
jgi:hypothetical protein